MCDKCLVKSFVFNLFKSRVFTLLQFTLLQYSLSLLLYIWISTAIEVQFNYAGLIGLSQVEG